MGVVTQHTFAIGNCSLGSILVAATANGISAILLGDRPEELTAQLRHRFPAARLRQATAELETLLATVTGFVDAPARDMDLPLDVRGTAFQQQVWDVLRQIPAGSTMSYGEVAARIGAPSAARAVARACASNTIAVAIPCHRVVNSDRSLSGYRWGVDRKRALLEQEAAV